MSALDILAMCHARGVQLVADGACIVLRGHQAARDEMRPLVATHKLELLAVLRSTTAATTARQPLPPNGPGERWAYNWRGLPVNLWGLRPGEDGRPSIFVSPKPEWLQ
jgi:hypothetical protein